MAYDEELADRIRELLVGESDLTEKTVFGGLAFLIRGNMAVAASGQGGVLVRVDPTESDSLVVAANALAKWVGIGTTYARSLPAKKAVGGNPARKEWDSNPRRPEDLNGFRGRPIRPLWHPSGGAAYWRRSAKNPVSRAAHGSASTPWVTGGL